MSNSTKTLRYFFLVLSAFFYLHLSEGEEPQKESFPVFTSQRLTLKEGWNVVSYEGDVKMTYGETSLAADKVTYWKKTGIVRAEGKVVFRKGKQFISGEEMEHNVNTGRGTVRFAASAMYPWYGWGEKITRLSEKLYKVENGYVTTSEYLRPRWRIQAREILLYRREKIVAKGAVFYVGKVPVLYVPRYTLRLNDTRLPFTISPGHNSDWGGYLLTAYNTVIKGIKTSFHLGYRQKNGFTTGVDAAFSTTGGKGLLETHYANDEKRQFPNGKIEHDQRYRIHYSQTQDLGRNISATVEINKLSDADFLEDLFRDKYEEESQPQSFINITKYNPRYTLNLFARKQLNEFFNVTERLPELSMYIRSQRIAGTPFYYRGVNSFINLRREFADDSEPSYDSLRFDTYHGVSFPRKYFGWLVMVPRIWLRGTYFSEGVEGDNLFRKTAGTELELFTKIFRTWNVQKPKLGINALRHVVEPSVTYAYAPDPNVDREEVFRFDKVDTVDYLNRVRLGVRNKLQTKGKKRTWDLIDLEAYTYYFPTGNLEGNSFSDVFLELEIWPSEHLKLESDARWDTYDGKIEELNTRFTVYNRDKWAANVEHRRLADRSDLLASELYYRINEDWRVKVYERYELNRHDLEEIEVAVSRDFQDWRSVFSFRRRENDNQFWVVFYLKGYPEMPVPTGH